MSGGQALMLGACLPMIALSGCTPADSHDGGRGDTTYSGGDGAGTPGADGAPGDNGAGEGDPAANSGDEGQPGDWAIPCDAPGSLAELVLPGMECTAVFRLDYQSLGLLGFNVLCGLEYVPSESEARHIAETVASCDSLPVALHQQDPADEFLFYDEPDNHGCVAVVSARTALPLFGAHIFYDAYGAVDFPSCWQDPGLLVMGTDPLPETVPVEAHAAFRPGTADALLAPDDVNAAVDAVVTTSIADEVIAAGHPHDIVVVLFTPCGGAIIDWRDHAEWIVMLNFGTD